LLKEFQRIERPHHGSRQGKTCGQSLAPFGHETGKTPFRLAKEAFDRHGGGPFLDHLGQLLATLDKGLGFAAMGGEPTVTLQRRIRSILTMLPVAAPNLDRWQAFRLVWRGYASVPGRISVRMTEDDPAGSHSKSAGKV
jgi:hypothetical protein